MTAHAPTQKGVPPRAYLTTEELASALHVEPESIHKARSKNGHYCGIQPIKLPNRRLAWPIDAIERITKIQ
ncbi:MAG: DNA-binding protein [Thiomonas arsenitoxydans]|nr:DNA-binding protein [Thiomonas arsenitoxydans]